MFHLRKVRGSVKELAPVRRMHAEREPVRQKTLMRAFSALGFLGVAFGAFGAHALRDKVTPAEVETWKTATIYLFVHTLAGIFSLVHLKKRAAAYLFLIGCILFSGSLYALVLTGIPSLGVITPIGGVCFLAAWALVLLSSSEVEGA